MQEITSSQNPRIKSAVQLHSSRGRKKHGQLIVIGFRECERAIQSKFEVESLFVCPELLSENQLETFVKLVPNSQCFSLTRELMDKIEFGDRSEGVALVAKRPDTSIQTLECKAQSLMMVLESIEKPGNLGAILRSCDGAGIDSVVLADPLTDFFHPNCIRASMGAVFSLRLGTGSSQEVCKFLADHEYAKFTAVVDAKADFQDCDFTSPRSALIFGNEASGLSACWRTHDCNSIFIPMRGICDSLNVSVSAAIVAYCAAGQRKRLDG